MHRRLAVRGLVQGVGFRPWVWQQATALGLIGWVRNTGFGVEIELQGAPALMDALQERLWQVPAPARVERVEVLPPLPEDLPAVPPSLRPFEIRPSLPAPHAWTTTIGADLSVCPRCLSELLDPANRRWRHPFIHCPQCGPRYTVTRSLPFDRAHTSMAGFTPCAACDAEYTTPSDRRFHDQTNACPQCGPTLRLTRVDGSDAPGDPIAATLALLRSGGIVAIKGLGGFHLCCDARNPKAVSTLRQRKGRPSKPLAVMVANLEALSEWAKASTHEQHWLASSARPIVLLKHTAQAQRELPGIAPGLAWLGVMLPYTPVHHLMFHDDPSLVLVMTSGNPSGAPLIIHNDTAHRELAEVADAWLLHDRDILARNDDSVLRVRSDGTACFIRRGRGYAPAPVAMPSPEPTSSASPGHKAALAPSVLALGAMLKATVCITQGDRALVSPHVGDLDGADTRQAFAQLAETWPAWLNTTPDAVACDLHPDFFSTRLAEQLAQAHQAPLIQIQHHHAHIAAVLAEHAGEPGAHEPVIGLALDGHGLGDDGQAWGGELLRVHGDHTQRLGHLLPLPLPGGDRAASEPWRMAAAVLQVLDRVDQIPQRFADHPQAALLHRWLSQTTTPLPQTTSLGRLFDAAAGLVNALGRHEHVQYEAEAAMRLESLASLAWPTPPLDQGWCITPDLQLDWRPLMHWMADQTSVTQRAATFHATLAAALADWAQQACQRQGIHLVVLSGGCMANRLLDEALTEHLRSAGLKVWRAAQYPCGDGGLSLGQAWIARQRLLRTPTPCASPSRPA